MNTLDKNAGRLISELLEEYAKPMAELQERLGKDEEFEDEQVLLRLLLQSDGDLDDAEAIARKGREDRLTYAKVLDMAKQNERPPQEKEVRKYLCFGLWQYPESEESSKWPPLVVTRSGKCDARACMDNISEEDMLEFFLWFRAKEFQDIHRITRETGRLTVMASVNDLADASLISSREPRLFSVIGKVSKLGEGMLPLVSRKHIMVNCGFFLQTLMVIARLFMPQKVLDKVAMMQIEDLHEAVGVPVSSLPAFLGGTCKVPKESPLFCPDDEEEKLDVLDIAGSVY